MSSRNPNACDPARPAGSAAEHGRVGPAPPPCPEQLLALAEVLDEIAAAQPLSDRVIAACGDPGPVPVSVAREGGRQTVICHRLGRRLRELALYGELAEARERATRLLDYQHWMVQQSLNLAFTATPDARTEAARLHLNGLGAPADELRALRDRVRAQTAAGPPAATGPATGPATEPATEPGTHPSDGNGQQAGTSQA
jgi:hypothetical protein